ncbi:MAG: integrase arm-type DNA-binding domain-containing protein [Rhizobiaceae bacterium]|nr:integrase arm-type DNA-binding domain-containing protein [Rhizobiaceae bacterium]
MAWTRDKLTDLTIRAIKPGDGIRKLSDGRGLQLWVTPRNGRYWRMEFRYHGKKKLLSLGTYPDITLEKARQKADEARRQLADGHDPTAIKRHNKAQAKLATENTFGSIAERLVAKKRKDGKADVTITKMEWVLGKLKRTLGPRPIDTIRTPDIIHALKKEEDADNLETARRMRTVIGEVFRYAMQHGMVDGDPSVATKGALANPKPKHHAAILDPQAYGALLRLIDGYAERQPITGSALQLMALLYPRPGELRQATWDEFDLERGIWQIPAERMKLRHPHAKPLPRQAVTILERLHDITGPQGYVFPALGNANRPMSENTMNGALRRMGIGADQHSSHGFRATASTLLNASNLFSIDAIEHSLAHQDRDAVRRAYARGDAMSERRKMAQWWADQLDMLRDGSASNVISMLPFKPSA